MKIIGHRGAMGLAPENTILSLEKALEVGVDEIEIDIRVTKDNVVILHHDKELTTPMKSHVRIKDHTLKELKKFKSDLITLSEAWDFVKFRVPLNLEVKPLEVTEPIVKLIESFKKPELIYLGSKSQTTLIELHKALPKIEKIVIEPWSGVRAEYRAKQVGARRFFVNQHWIWSGYIKSVTRNGHELYAYTVNDVAKAKNWEGYGLSGVITNYPDLFKK